MFTLLIINFQRIYYRKVITNNIISYRNQGYQNGSSYVVSNLSSYVSKKSRTTNVPLNGVGIVTFELTFDFPNKVLGICPANECVGVKSINGNKVTLQYNSTYTNNSGSPAVTIVAVGY